MQNSFFCFRNLAMLPALLLCLLECTPRNTYVVVEGSKKDDQNIQNSESNMKGDLDDEDEGKTDQIMEGVITGNGSGGIPDRKQLDEVPLKAQIEEFVSRLQAFEPTMVRILNNSILKSYNAVFKPIQYFKTVPKDGTNPDADHESEKCEIEGREVRAYFDPDTFHITFCRGFFWSKSSNFQDENSDPVKIMTILHEFMHVLFKITDTNHENEEEIVSSFDDIFLQLKLAGNENAYLSAALNLRKKLDESFEALGLQLQPLKDIGEITTIPILKNSETIRFPIPKAYFDEGYIAPHFLGLGLGMIYATNFSQDAVEFMTFKNNNLPIFVENDDLTSFRNEIFHQNVYKKMDDGNIHMKTLLLSLNTLNLTYNYSPNSDMYMGTVSKNELSDEMLRYLNRAGHADFNQSRLIRLVKFVANYDETKDGFDDFLIFIKE